VDRPDPPRPLVLLGAIYVAAEFDFFRRYGATDYVREHSLYWAALAVVAFLIWAFERARSRCVPEKRRAKARRRG
jgi:hypothetical protein